jgi:hypothetical protein
MEVCSYADVSLNWTALCDGRRLFGSTNLWRLSVFRHTYKIMNTGLPVCITVINHILNYSALKVTWQRFNCLLWRRIYTEQLHRKRWCVAWLLCRAVLSHSFTFKLYYYLIVVYSKTQTTQSSYSCSCVLCHTGSHMLVSCCRDSQCPYDLRVIIITMRPLIDEPVSWWWETSVFLSGLCGRRGILGSTLEQ